MTDLKPSPDYEWALRNTKTGKLRFVNKDAVQLAFLYEAFKTKGYELVRREIGPWEVQS